MTDVSYESVDVTGLDSSDPADLTTLALARAAEVAPGWRPREGNVEVVLLETLAVVVGEFMRRLETTPTDVTMQLLALSGLTRDPGSPASYAVRVDMADDLGHVVPAGTTVILGDPDGEDPLLATVAGDIAVATGVSSAVGVVVAEDVGVVDAVTVGSDLLLLDAVPYVTAVVVTGVHSPGSDGEDDAAYLARGAAWLTSMTQALVTPRQFEGFALSHPGVGRALAVNRWNGVPGTTPGSLPGRLAIVLLSTRGDAVTPAQLFELQAGIGERASIELVVSLTPAVVRPVDVTAAVTLRPGYAAATVRGQVTAAVSAWLDPLTWPWGDAVRVSRLRQVIETVPGVDAATITTPSQDVLIGAYELCRPGVVSVV